MREKDLICGLSGTVLGAVAQAFGGWDTSLATLLVFMALDYLTGLVAAGIFHKSNKTKSGALESNASFKGLCRKGAILGTGVDRCPIGAVPARRTRMRAIRFVSRSCCLKESAFWRTYA